MANTWYDLHKWKKSLANQNLINICHFQRTPWTPWKRLSELTGISSTTMKSLRYLKRRIWNQVRPQSDWRLWQMQRTNSTTCSISLFRLPVPTFLCFLQWTDQVRSCGSTTTRWCPSIRARWNSLRRGKNGFSLCLSKNRDATEKLRTQELIRFFASFFSMY
jgi:hypothetical protein